MKGGGRAPALRWDPALAPAYSRYLELTHGATRYQVAGPVDGAPVVLVHGLTYPMEVWSEQFEHLAQAGHRVCRYDLYGRGFSAFDGAALPAERLAGQLRELLDLAGFERPAALVSLSNADLVVAAFARAQPERVRGLVWVAPGGWDRRTMGWSARWTRRAPGVQPLLERTLRARCVRRMEAHRTHLPAGAGPSAQAAYDLSIRSARESPAFAPAVMSQLRHLPDARGLRRDLAALAALRLPTTLIHFRSEADATEESSRVLREQVPHCQAVTLEGTHMGLLEQPQSVNDAIARCCST